MSFTDDDPLGPTAPNLRPPLANSSSPREHEPDTLDELRKWQEERIQRRLRGEYESATRRLGELITTNMDHPTRIKDVRVVGRTNTRSSFLGSLIEPHLTSTSASTPETLEGALHRVANISNTLYRTDIFSSVDATLERSRSPLAGNQDVDVVLKVRDKPRMFLKGSTETGNSEGSATATARIRNTFGGAETLEGSVSFGTRTKKAFQVRLEAPLSHSLLTRGELSVFRFERDQTTFASSNEGVTGAKATIRAQSILGLHEIAYEGSLRRVKELTPAASISIREAAGQTVKSAISHTLIRDTRDHPITGTRGSYTKLVHELAGLGGDASYWKTESLSQLSRQIFPGSTLSFTTRTGFLYPLFGKPSLFSDRFQLGGPTSVRQFKQNGLGPKDGGMLGFADSLGGDMFWSAGLSLISDIPRKPQWPFKTHVFVNAGGLNRVDPLKPILPTVKELVTQPSISAGVGLIYKFDPVRLEVNFGVPLVASKTDVLRRGIQVGLGLEFL